ncbi:alanine dehydrogenase [Paludibacterium purpuratum]|uniref:Alanine dehydrogenase n=1 Tax=Paludibacterium purpuratum TaxID=1144873 RepID=A0A4R7AZF2_9NEIS|nr:alanine dehydrogenase [Paludibacterium purpuratum]TDR73811.1 alanine dehydrogenase [Paludibacterium purpuratum]
MLIGVPKEIKNHEYRVGLTPSGAREMIAHGHKVLVETQAGLAIGFTDEQYIAAGASIAPSAKAVFDQAEMIIKVKEPQPVECRMLRPGQILFTYLHLAPDPEQTRLLIESGAIAVAYETVTDERGGLPLLAPMSEVAGRMAIQAGAHALEKAQGGRGVLLGGVPGVAPAKVVVIGGGVVGLNAARMAMGMGADVTILDKSLNRLKEIDMVFEGRIKTLVSNTSNIEEQCEAADLVVGAVLVPGALAPKLVTRSMLKKMQAGAVLVDVAIDQGGCFETSHATTHQEPIYVVDGVVHYCVANMPGGVARTSTLALSNATLPFALELANKGWAGALLDNVHLRNGLNICRGKVTYEAVAKDLGYQYVEPVEAIKASS